MALTFAVDSEVVVPIDEFSASSSEILSGALKDNDRGLIIVGGDRLAKVLSSSNW